MGTSANGQFWTVCNGGRPVGGERSVLADDRVKRIAVKTCAILRTLTVIIITVMKKPRRLPRMLSCPANTVEWKSAANMRIAEFAAPFLRQVARWDKFRFESLQ